MTSTVTQRIVDRLQSLPDDREPLIMNFISTISASTEENERKARANAFLDSFMNVDIDEQVVTDFREGNMI